MARGRTKEPWEFLLTNVTNTRDHVVMYGCLDREKDRSIVLSLDVSATEDLIGLLTDRVNTIKQHLDNVRTSWPGLKNPYVILFPGSNTNPSESYLVTRYDTWLKAYDDGDVVVFDSHVKAFVDHEGAKAHANDNNRRLGLESKETKNG